MCVELHILMDTALSFCFELQRPRRRIFILRRGLSPYTALSPIGSHCVPMGLNLLGCPFIWSGQRGSNSLPGIPQMAFVHLQEPCLTSDFIRAPARGGGSAFVLLPKRKRTSQLGCPFIWSGQRGSNSLPPPWQGGALPDELCPRNECYFNKYIPSCQGKIKSFLNFFVSCTFACNFSPAGAYTA